MLNSLVNHPQFQVFTWSLVRKSCPAAGGFISKTYAIEFLEAQAATGCIIDPMTGEAYSPSDAFEKGIITGDLKDKINEAYKAVSGYTHAGKIISVFQAMEERILDRHRGRALIETQIAT